MPDKMLPDGYDELITPINEEGNRTKNDPDTKNVPTNMTVPDPLGITQGIFSGGSRKAETPPPKGK